MKKIIDVSKYNGGIDFKAVKKDGIDGVIVQLGYGSNIPAQDDYMLLENVNKAYSVGLKVGVYLYSYAMNYEQAKSEAEHTIRCLRDIKKKIIGPVWYDLEEERYGYFAKNALQTYANVMNEAGWRVGIYTGHSFFKRYLKGLSEIYPLWLASYGGDNGTAWTDYKPNEGEMIWQYSSKGLVRGITGFVDVNIDYGWIDYEGGEENLTRDETEKLCNDMIYKYIRVAKQEVQDELMQVMDRKIDKAIESDIYRTIDDVPEFGKGTVEKLIEKGYLAGDQIGFLNISRQMLRTLVILDRAGKFDD